MEDHSYCKKEVVTPTAKEACSTSGSPQVSGPSRFKCGMCDKSFKYKNGLNKHKVRAHSAVAEGKTKCLEAGCSRSFRTSDPLKKHLCAVHNMQFSSEIKSFINMEEFLVWKGDIEEKNNVRYVLLKGVSQHPEKNVRYFKCHRSGKYVPAVNKRQRKLKSQGTAKVGQLCTSQMIVTESTINAHVSVNYCMTHYGHEMGLTQLSHLFLTKTEKDSSDITPEDVSNKAHKAAEILQIVKKPEDELEKKKNTFKALCLSSLAALDTCEDINIIDTAMPYLKKINNIFAMGPTDQQHSNKEPPNKLMLKQLRFKSTKRKRKQNQMLAKRKPNTIEMNTIKDELSNMN